ncbi:TPA: hypothetical protein RQN23_003760 [Aeromonas veronii]|nr:hypothetical protein [Aeromonas veronii]
MLRQPDVERFLHMVKPGSSALLKAMQELEDWVSDEDIVAGQLSIKEQIEALSDQLEQEDGIPRLLNVDNETLLKGLMHLNAPRFSILLDKIGNYDLTALGDILRQQGPNNQPYTFVYLLRIVMMIQYGLITEMFGSARLNEIRLIIESGIDQNSRGY